MKAEFSYGIIPLKRSEQNGWEVLLICHTAGGFWSFPKGHAERAESPLEAAKRELFEETGFTVASLCLEETFTENYTFQSTRGLINKTVTYFAAEVAGRLNLQPEEVADAIWVPLTQASDKLTFPEAKRILSEVTKLLIP